MKFLPACHVALSWVAPSPAWAALVRNVLLLSRPERGASKGCHSSRNQPAALSLQHRRAWCLFQFCSLHHQQRGTCIACLPLLVKEGSLWGPAWFWVLTFHCCLRIITVCLVMYPCPRGTLQAAHSSDPFLMGVLSDHLLR